MNESEWMAATDPRVMLQARGGKAAERKLRLFGLACCRRVWPLLPTQWGTSVVEVGERFIEGAANRQDLLSAWWRTPTRPADPRADHLAVMVNKIGSEVLTPERAQEGAYAAAKAMARAVDDKAGVERFLCPPRDAERVAQAHLLRDILGNPFRPLPPLAPALLTWRDGLVVNLARAAYNDRLLPSGHLDPARLAVLADSLSDAGCIDAQILEHLRGPGPHERGCHVVDLLLGKG